MVTIQQLSEQLGLTSRTLRHWEAEGLFQSYREVSSGWRTYDEQALRCIRITALLRRMDIPIKEIQAVFG
ncbi:MerR family transcriptional regulator [Paenibacillus rhizoplanae]